MLWVSKHIGFKLKEDTSVFEFFTKDLPSYGERNSFACKMMGCNQLVFF